MVFGSPWMLIGLGLCAAPVLIHLLSQRVHRREPWAAMRFLRSAIDRRAQQLRLESLLLLLARTILIALVVLAVAEPLARPAGVAALSRTPVRRIIVVDLSASMGTMTDGRRAVDRLRAEVDRLLDDSLPGDTFQLIRIAAAPPRTLIRRTTFDPEEVRAELSRWKLTGQAGDLLDSLQAILDLLRTVGPEVETEVVICSDLQRSNWSPDRIGEDRSPVDLLRQLAQRSRLRIIDVGSATAENLAMVALETERSMVSPGEDFDVRAVIRNLGRSPVSVGLDWTIDGRRMDSTRVEIDGLSQYAVREMFRAPPGRFLEVQAELTAEDALAIDNRRYLTLPVRDALKVLLVDGRPGLDPIDGAAGFVELALAPPAPSSGALAPAVAFQPTVISEVELADVELDDYQCVWLCNVGGLDARQQRRLAGYVERGGGLVLSVGDQTRGRQWNEWKATNGEPVLPVTLEDAAEASVGAKWATLPLDESPHPVMSPFAGNPNSGLATTRFNKYVRAQLLDEQGGREVLAFNNGDPAIAARLVGLGRTVVVLTSADDRWGNWGVWPSFLPMVHRLTQFAASGSAEHRELTVGQPIERSWPAARRPAELLLTDPSDHTISLAIRCDEDVCRARSAATEAVGFYRLESNPAITDRESVSVNLDLRESLPARLDESELKELLPPQANFQYHTKWPQQRAAPAARSRGAGLSQTLLIAALVLLSVERLMAWRCQWGVTALLIAVTCAGCVQAAQVSVGLAWLLGVSVTLVGGLTVSRLTTKPTR